MCVLFMTGFFLLPVLERASHVVRTVLGDSFLLLNRPLRESTTFIFPLSNCTAKKNPCRFFFGGGYVDIHISDRLMPGSRMVRL